MSFGAEWDRASTDEKLRILANAVTRLAALLDLDARVRALEIGHQNVASAREDMVKEAQRLDKRVENIEDNLGLSGRPRK
jgi:hypothetical protein